MPAGILPDVSLIAGDRQEMGLAPLFTDPDGDPLSYTATVSGSMATATVSDSSLSIVAKSGGDGNLTVTAKDTDGLTATQTATIKVTSLSGTWQGQMEIDDVTFDWTLQLDQSETAVRGDWHVRIIEFDVEWDGQLLSGDYTPPNLNLSWNLEIDDDDIPFRYQGKVDVASPDMISGTIFVGTDGIPLNLSR